MSSESSYSDVTSSVRTLCASLGLGGMVSSPQFQMFDAMHALELMDPKLDPGLAVLKPAGDRAALASQGKVKYRITAEELLSVLDGLMSMEVSFLDGYSLVTTIFTCVYLQELQDLGDKLVVKIVESVDLPKLEKLLVEGFVLFGMALVNSCFLIREIIQKGEIFEEEDFSLHQVPKTLYPIETPIDEIFTAFSKLNMELVKRIDNKRIPEHEQAVLKAIVMRWAFRVDYLAAMYQLAAFSQTPDNVNICQMAAQSIFHASSRMSQWAKKENGKCSFDLARNMAPGFFPASVAKYLVQSPRAIRLFTRIEASFAMQQHLDHILRFLSMHVDKLIPHAQPCQDFEDVFCFTRNFVNSQHSIHPIVMQQQVCLYSTLQSGERYEFASLDRISPNLFYPFHVPLVSFSKTLADGKEKQMEDDVQILYGASPKPSMFCLLSPETITSAATASVFSFAIGIVARSLLSIQVGPANLSVIKTSPFIGRLEPLPILLRVMLQKFSVPPSMFTRLEAISKKVKAKINKAKSNPESIGQSDTSEMSEFDVISELVDNVALASVQLIRVLCFNSIRQAYSFSKIYDDWNSLQQESEIVDSIYVSFVCKKFNLDTSTLSTELITSESLTIYPHPFFSFVSDFVCILHQMKLLNGYVTALYSPIEVIPSYWYLEKVMGERINARKTACMYRSWKTLAPIHTSVAPKKTHGKEKEKDSSRPDFPDEDWTILRNLSIMPGHKYDLRLDECMRLLALGICETLRWLNQLPIKSNPYQIGKACDDYASYLFYERYEVFRRIKYPIYNSYTDYLKRTVIDASQESQIKDGAKQCFKLFKMGIDSLLNNSMWSVPAFQVQYLKSLLRICAGNLVLFETASMTLLETPDAFVHLDWATSAIYPVISLRAQRK